MKIAQFKSLEYGYESIQDESFEDIDDYIRISEYIDVEFTEINREEIVSAEISVIDKKIKSVNLAANQKVSELERIKAELLAIPDMSNE